MQLVKHNFGWIQRNTCTCWNVLEVVEHTWNYLNIVCLSQGNKWKTARRCAQALPVEALEKKIRTGMDKWSTGVFWRRNQPKSEENPTLQVKIVQAFWCYNQIAKWRHHGHNWSDAAISCHFMPFPQIFTFFFHFSPFFAQIGNSGSSQPHPTFWT